MALPTHEAWQVILGLNNGRLTKEVMTSKYLDDFGPRYDEEVKLSCLKCFVNKGYITCKGKESFKTTAIGDEAYRKYINKEYLPNSKPKPADDPFC